MARRRPGRLCARRSFTLLEMLVAIGIVIFLAGITLTIGAAVARRSDMTKTETTLRLLDAALTEFETLAQRSPTWGTKDQPYLGADYDMHENTPFSFLMTELLTTIERPQGVKDILARIDPSSWYEYEEGVVPPWLSTPSEQQALPQFIGKKTILDAWGIPIYPTHPGALPPPGYHCPDGTLDCLDDDGTFNTYNERYFGSARHRRICFVSAGPDRQFGNVSAVRTSPLFKQSLDNVYSYVVLGEE